MRVDGNGGAAPNFSPSGRGVPVAQVQATEVAIPLAGATGRTEYPQGQRADDFEQAGLLYRVMKPDERMRLVNNIAGHLGAASRAIQQRQLHHFLKADPEYGARVAEALRLTPADAVAPAA